MRPGLSLADQPAVLEDQIIHIPVFRIHLELPPSFKASELVYASGAEKLREPGRGWKKGCQGRLPQDFLVKRVDRPG